LYPNSCVIFSSFIKADVILALNFEPLSVLIIRVSGFAFLYLIAFLRVEIKSLALMELPI
jgi:hypothetical protein